MKTSHISWPKRVLMAVFFCLFEGESFITQGQSACPSLLPVSLLATPVSLFRSFWPPASTFEHPGSRLVLDALITEFTASPRSTFGHEERKRTWGGRRETLCWGLLISLLRSVSSDVRRKKRKWVLMTTERASDESWCKQTKSGPL